jgi:hypothetical protein
MGIGEEADSVVPQGVNGNEKYIQVFTFSRGGKTKENTEKTDGYMFLYVQDSVL